MLYNSNSEVNTIYLTFAQELGFSIRSTDIRAQKIDNTMLDTYRIIFAAFLVTDKVNQIRFFEQTFLVTNVCLEVVFGIFFLILNSVNIDFLEQELR